MLSNARGDTAGALQTLATLRKAFEINGAVLESVAETYAKYGRFADAKEAVRQALSAASADSTTEKRLRNLNEELKRF